eukprot:TRINITY_DN1270_c0_g2_i3.p1 TRINITY_DN1270_c0_g2~~TRINITY_DN1270_c0_g2_i3.p1  ORF type:complete len:808 (-),score=171.89 TRINITY_DN1270_c0_g2_i3:185-2608(-)
MIKQLQRGEASKSGVIRLITAFAFVVANIAHVSVADADARLIRADVQRNANIAHFQRKLLSKDISSSSLSAKLSESLHDRKKGLPRRTIENKQVPNRVEFNTDYLQSIGLLAVPGLVLSILFFLYSILVGGFTFCCPDCCPCNKVSGTEDDMKHKERRIYYSMALNGFIILFFCCVVFATAPYMASGVDQVIDSVTDVVSDTVDVVVDVSDASSDLAVAIPRRMDLIVQNLSVVNDLIGHVQTLENQLDDVNQDLTTLDQELDALELPPYGDLSQTQSLIDSVSKSLSDASAVVNDLQQLLNSLTTDVQAIYDDMVATIDDKRDEIQDITDDLVKQLDEISVEAEDIEKTIVDEAEDVSSYQNMSAQGTAAFFVVPFLGCFLTALALYFRNKPLSIISYFLLFLSGIILWLLFAAYLPVGVLMTDYCDEPYEILNKALDYVDGDPGDAIKGCFDRQSIFVTLGYDDELQVSKYFDYDDYVADYFDFRKGYNVSALSEYVDDLAALTEYNVLSDISSLTPAAYGFDESLIQEGLDDINDVTVSCCDSYYTTSNISSLDPQNLPGVPPDKVKYLNDTKGEVEGLITQNTTVYTQIDDLTNDLVKIQNDLDALSQDVAYILSNFTLVEETLLQVDLCVLGVGVIINITQADIDNIVALCDCSYVADAYAKLVDGICVTTIAGVDVIWFCAVTIAGGMWTHTWLSRSVFKRIRIKTDMSEREMSDLAVVKDEKVYSKEKGIWGNKKEKPAEDLYLKPNSDASTSTTMYPDSSSPKSKDARKTKGIGVPVMPVMASILSEGETSPRSNHEDA